MSMSNVNMDIDKEGKDIKYLILNSYFPLLFKDFMKWDLLRWSLQDWHNVLKHEVMEFRSGSFEATKEPQWERTTEVMKEKFDYFLKNTEVEECNKWLYFDYKHLHNNLVDCQELRDEIDWSDLGFPEITADSSTVWIGTKGAHTPCHVDTYGCNLIVQVYGRKMWLIFPPETNLKPTRIPYEESSIYSRLNFFSPTLNDFKGINNCRKIILNPGDVLFLPHRWWHYVENLETAISVNAWLPLDLDDEERLKESLVQFLVKQVVDATDKDTANVIINPNMEEILSEENKNILEGITRSRSICMEKQSNKKQKTGVLAEENSSLDVDDILKKYDNIKKIDRLSYDSFQSLLNEQKDRFSNKYTCDNVPMSNNMPLDILGALTDSEVITLITEKLLRRIES